MPRLLSSASAQDWAEFSAGVIGSAIAAAIVQHGECNVMLTGGNSAERLYNHWSYTSTLPFGSIRFFFGDERCVPPDHIDSNYALAMRTLFSGEVPQGFTIVRMEAERLNREEAALAYEAVLPERIDVLLLGMGSDGHIASLFPQGEALRVGGREVLPVLGKDIFHERLTITPHVIARARMVFLLAPGKEKGKVLAEALKSPQDYFSLPVRLTAGGTWLLDDAAWRELEGVNIRKVE